MNETPIVAGWSLTKKCNLNCIHCYNASGKAQEDELTTQEALMVIDKLADSNVSAVNFGGGECALRKDFIDICRVLKDKQIKISYTTNGTTLSIIKPHLHLFNDIGVSIDFSDAERHDLFRGTPGTFDKAVNCLEVIVDNNVDSEIVTCLTKLNCSIGELTKIYDLANFLNVGNWRLNRFRSNGRGIDNKSYLALNQEELKTAYGFLAKHMDDSVSVPEPLFRSAYGGRYSVEGDPSGFTAFRIRPNGEVSPSVFLSKSGGNIKTKTIQEILDSEIFRQIRERNPRGKCLTCSAYSHCKGGDAGASYLEYGHFDGPDPLCWLKPDDKRAIPEKRISDKWNVHEMYLCTVYIPIGGKNDS